MTEELSEVTPDAGGALSSSCFSSLFAEDRAVLCPGVDELIIEAFGIVANECY